MSTFIFLKRHSLLFLLICSLFSLQAQNGGLKMDSFTTCNGKNISVAVNADSWDVVGTIQFGLIWNPAVLQFVDLGLPNETFSEIFTATQNASNGQLNVAWYDESFLGVTLSNEVIFNINFNVIGQDGESSLIEFSDTAILFEFTYVDPNDPNNLIEFDPVLENGLVKIESPKIASVVIDNENGSNADGAVSISVSGDNGPWSINWDNDANGSTINNLSAGDYFCTVTDAISCASNHGPFTVESLSSTNNLSSLTQFELLPNPASEFVNVNVAFAQNDKTNIRVLDINGKTHYQSKQDGDSFQLSIPVTDMVNGTYFLELSTSQGTAIEKLIIAK